MNSELTVGIVLGSVVFLLLDWNIHTAVCAHYYVRDYSTYPGSGLVLWWRNWNK